MEGTGEGHRFGVVALSGPPNVGKSTLLNAMMGEKVSIISRRPHTTRHRIVGIKTMPHAQVVLLDTPGLQMDGVRVPNSRGLARTVRRTALGSVAGVDLILFMIDGRGWTARLRRLLREVVRDEVPVILIINKIDRLRERSMVLPLIKCSAEVYPFKAIIPLCALRMKADDVDYLFNIIVGAVPVGEAGYAVEQRSERGERFFAAELVREQTFRLLGQELPYASAVEVVVFGRDEEGVVVEAVVWVEKTSQRRIVMGHGGHLLRTMTARAQRSMERAFGVSVRLELWVKVRRGWGDDAALLQVLGYAQE